MEVHMPCEHHLQDCEMEIQLYGDKKEYDFSEFDQLQMKNF